MDAPRTNSIRAENMRAWEKGGRQRTLRLPFVNVHIKRQITIQSIGDTCCPSVAVTSEARRNCRQNQNPIRSVTPYTTCGRSRSYHHRPRMNTPTHLDVYDLDAPIFPWADYVAYFAAYAREGRPRCDVDPSFQSDLVHAEVQ